MKENKYIDLSILLTKDTPVFPGEPNIIFKKHANIKENTYNEHQITINTHFGTHMDFPYHMIDDGKKSSDFKLENFNDLENSERPIAKYDELGLPNIEYLKKLEKGVEVEGRVCTPTRVKLKKNDLIKNYAIVEITIIEGRNHIIKKVFENLGYLVDKLTRVEYAFLNVDKLKSGEYRSLTIKEVKKLYEYKN